MFAVVFTITRLMLTLEQVDAFSAFKKQISRENVAKDFHRFQQLALIGSDAARAWQQIAFLHQCVELEGNARWWHYLNLLGIECDHKAFQSERRDLAYIRRLVPALIVKSNYDFYTVLEFARHYQIDDNFSSLAYVEALLLRKGDSITDLEYQDKIVGVLEDIHEQHLISLLLKSVPKISGVDYNRLLFAFRLLLENTNYPDRDEVERRIEALHILQVYTAMQAQKAGFGEGEDDGRGVSKQLNVHLLGQVSFHDLIAKPRDVLSQLLSKDNFETLFDLAGPLRLQTDELQMLLLKNLVQRYFRSGADSTGYREDGQDPAPQFELFHEILSRLTETENKVTAGEWLAENFPFGEEKLKAMEFALVSARLGSADFADDTKERSSGRQTFTGVEALSRLETKILRVKVELLLRATIFDEPIGVVGGAARKKEIMRELLQLVAQPAELLFELYRRFSLQSYELNRETLHEVVDKLEALFGTSAHKVRRELINEWLVKDAVLRVSCTPSDECIFEPLENETMERTDEEHTKRLVFVAVRYVQEPGQSGGGELFEFLVRFAKDVKPRAGVTFRAKLRALQVALRLVQLDPSAAASAVASKYQLADPASFFKEIADYARHCSHMVYFEERRVPYDIAFLLKTDKEVIVRSLLRQYSTHQPWMLRCASRLMLDFGVHSIELWEIILRGMMKLKMVRSLSRILEQLSKEPFVRGLEDGRLIWEFTLLQPLERLGCAKCESMQLSIAVEIGDLFSSERREDSKPSKADLDPKEVRFGGFRVDNVRAELEHMVILLQKCPFLDQIDVTAFVVQLRDLSERAQREDNGAEILRRLDLYGFAVRCAMLIPKPATRLEALMRIIQAGAYMSVLRELQGTSCLFHGEADADADSEFAEQLRLVQGAFAEAKRREAYSEILNTPFEQDFIEFLAATGSIDHVVGILCVVFLSLDCL